MSTTSETRVAQRKELQGIVVSDAMDKTVVIRVDRTKKHPRYSKVVRLSRKVHVHDERNDAHVGDTIRVISCRPMSKTKTWRLAEVVERAK
jgi:small subunit ribosomal protein S17